MNIEELERRLENYLRYKTTSAFDDFGEAAVNIVPELIAELKRLRANEDCYITVGNGLVVSGSIEAVGRVQDYMLLNSTHPQEKADVRRSLMQELQKAEAELKMLRVSYEEEKLKRRTLEYPSFAPRTAPEIASHD